MKQTDRHRQVQQWFDDYHEELLRRLSSTRPSHSSVKDLAQEVFLRVLRVSDPELIRHPRAYLLRIAAHVLQEWQQRGSRFVSTEPEWFDAIPETANPPADADSRERTKWVNAALQTLPPLYRSAIALKTQYGFSLAEVALHLGVTERSAKRYIEKGYAKLRHHLAHDNHGHKR